MTQTLSVGVAGNTLAMVVVLDDDGVDVLPECDGAGASGRPAAGLRLR